MKKVNILSALSLCILSYIPIYSSPLIVNDNKEINLIIKDTEFKNEFLMWANKEIQALQKLQNKEGINKTFKSKDLKEIFINTNAEFTYINKVYSAMGNTINSNEMSINDAIKGCLQAIDYAKKEIINSYANIYKNDKNALKAAKAMVFNKSLEMQTSPSKYLGEKLIELSKSNNNSTVNNNSNNHLQQQIQKANNQLQEAKESMGWGNSIFNNIDSISDRMDANMEDNIEKSKIKFFNMWFKDNTKYLELTKTKYLYVKTKKISYRKLKKELNTIYFDNSLKYLTPYLLQNIKKKSYKIPDLIDLLQSNVETMNSWSDDRKADFGKPFGISVALDRLIKVK